MHDEKTAEKLKIIHANLVAKYQERYPKLSDFRIRDVKLDRLGGSFALVEYEDGPDHCEEICFVTKDNLPDIADSDRHLLDIILRQVDRKPLLQQIFAREVVAGVVFFVVVIGVMFAMFTDAKSVNDPVLTILGSLAGTAGGFFFGSTKAT